MTTKDLDALLTLLQRVIEADYSESVKRVANSLFTLLSRERFSDTIEL